MENIDNLKYLYDELSIKELLYAIEVDETELESFKYELMEYSHEMYAKDRLHFLKQIEIRIQCIMYAKSLL